MSRVIRSVYPFAWYSLQPYVLLRMRHELCPAGAPHRAMFQFDADDALKMAAGWVRACVQRDLKTTAWNAVPRVDWVEFKDACQESVKDLVNLVAQGRLPPEPPQSCSDTYTDWQIRACLQTLKRARKKQKRLHASLESRSINAQDDLNQNRLRRSIIDNGQFDEWMIESDTVLDLQKMLGVCQLTADEACLLALHLANYFNTYRVPAFGAEDPRIQKEIALLAESLPARLVAPAVKSRPRLAESLELRREALTGRRYKDLAEEHGLTPPALSERMRNANRAIVATLTGSESEYVEGEPPLYALLDGLQRRNIKLRSLLAKLTNSPARPTATERVARTQPPSDLALATIDKLVSDPGTFCVDKAHWESACWFALEQCKIRSPDVLFSELGQRLMKENPDYVPERVRRSLGVSFETAVAVDFLDRLAPRIFSFLWRLRSMESPPVDRGR